jgi:ubiquinone/menaquinone biosynthesis C-methylase UbiE
VEESSQVKTTKNLSTETHWEKAARTRMGRYLTRIERDFIFRSITQKQTCVIMDVGAEAGRFSLQISDRKATLIGIDIDSYGLKRLRLKNKNVAVIQADARKIPLKEGTFDAIFMIEVLDYITELNETLFECHRTLKADGSLFLSFGNKSSLKSRFRELRGKSYRHSYNKVLRSLSKTGFITAREMGYSWLPFGRTSESRLIPFLAKIERILALRRVPMLSPWVIVYSVKSDKHLSIEH